MPAKQIGFKGEDLVIIYVCRTNYLLIISSLSSHIIGIIFNVYLGLRTKGLNLLISLNVLVF